MSNILWHCEVCGEEPSEEQFDEFECCGRDLCDGQGSLNFRIGVLNRDNSFKVTGSARGCCGGKLDRELPAGISVISEIR